MVFELGLKKGISLSSYSAWRTTIYSIRS